MRFFQLFKSFLKKKESNLPIFEELCNAESYLKILDLKISRFMLDLSFASFAQSCDGSLGLIAKKIADELKSQTYLPGIVKPVLIKNGHKKPRHVFVLPAKDQLVMNVLYNCLTRYCSNQDYKNVYSYRPRKSYFHAVKYLSTYIKKHQIEGHCDLFVLKCDFSNYTDNIPVDKSSLIWEQIDQLLKRAPKEKNEQNHQYLFQLIQNGVCPLIDHKDGTMSRKEVGLPMGSPITPVLANMYANSIDHCLSKIEGAFYARFCDDLIFCHTDYQCVKKAAEQLFKISENLKLIIHPGKTQFIYLTHCGKTSDQCSDFKGASYIDFLGHCIYGEGSIAASSDDVKKLLRNVRRSLKTTSNHLKFCEGDGADKSIQNPYYRKRLHYLVNTANKLLSVDSELANPVLLIILQKCSDPRQLRYIDQQVLLMLAQFTFGEFSRKVLRKLSFKQIIELEKVESLEHCKNSKKNTLWTKYRRNKVSLTRLFC